VTGHEPVHLLAAALVAGGVLHLATRLVRARRLLRTTPEQDRRGPARVLDVVTIGYAVILAIGLVVGFATGSAAWGVGVVVGMSVLAMLVAVVVMLVLAVRSGRPR
jgi:hypothetical protein